MQIRYTWQQTMTCEHLRPLEQAMIAAGMAETFRGQAWSNNCREWVYFNCFIDTAAVRKRFNFADCVTDHAHRGTHDGQERGLYAPPVGIALWGLMRPFRGFRFSRDDGTHFPLPGVKNKSHIT
jgi:hypothetical protein